MGEAVDDPERDASEPRLLTRRLAVTAAAVVLGASLPHAAQANDDPGGQASVGNCAATYICVGASDPGKPRSPSQSANSHKSPNGKEPKVTICKVQRLSPQPPAGSAMWEGHKPGQGAIYTRQCIFGPDNPAFRVGAPSSRTFWAATPPAATGPDPAQLAQQAVDKMLLKGPDINSPKPAPPSGCGKEAKAPAGFGCYTVGVPVWMSLGTSDTTWGPNRASASAGGMTVTATARVSKVLWTMGDGATVTCTKPGTPYKASYGARKSPDCGHLYARTSEDEKEGTYAVSATSTWDIDWNGGGQQGQLTETRTSQVRVNTTELQVVS